VNELDLFLLGGTRLNAENPIQMPALVRTADKRVIVHVVPRHLQYLDGRSKADIDRVTRERYVDRACVRRRRRTLGLR
jgi:hypothetical protein